MNITNLMPGTWAVEDGNVRFFILEGTEKSLVIDSGISGQDIQEIVSSVTDRPPELLNTHADPDHISGNAGFEWFYMHPSDAFVYHKIHHQTGRIVPVYEGTILDPGGRRLEILHVPGHSPGSVTVLDIKNRCLIGGDPVQQNGNIFMFGIHRDIEAYIMGLEHLLARSGGFDEIYPSHADMPVSKDVIPQLIAGARDLLAGKLTPQRVQIHGREVNRYDLGVSEMLYLPD